MSSSNRVKIAAIEESVYGETPVAGNFDQPRYTAETLSGTPDTTESQQIRTDRYSSGQVVVGLEVGGDLTIEVAKEAAHEKFMASAMMNDWDVLAPITADLTIAAGAKTITRAAGSFIDDGIKKGDFIVLSDFTEPENNVMALVAAVTATVLTVITENALEDENAAAGVITRCDKLTIGTTQKSFSMEKIFDDLTTKAIEYRGMVVGAMEITATYGELMTGSFTFSGNDYKAVSTSGEMMTDGRVINPQATSDTLNGSVDMPFLATSATGVALASGDLCIQTAGITLDNNLEDLTCIGKAAPEGYDAGTASVGISLSTYLKDSSWALLPKKLTQEAFELAFAVRNSAGGYGFYLPAVQVSFDDPASAGANQQVSLEMEGSGKVGPNGESPLTIFRF